MKSRKTRTVTAGLMLIGGGLVGLLLFEGLLRLIEPASDAQVLEYSETDTGTYSTLIPGAHGLILGRHVAINERGYRGVLRDFEKPEGVVRTLIFGDSHTFSMGAGEDDTYPVVVERILNRRNEVHEVINFGILGQDLRQIIVHIGKNAFLYDPDIVVITFHSGDILESVETANDERGQVKADVGLLYRIKRDLLAYSYTARLVIPYLALTLRRTFNWGPGVTVAEFDEIRHDGPTWRRLQDEILALKRKLDQNRTRLAIILFAEMTAFDDHPVRPTHQLLQEWMNSKGIAVLDLLPYFAGHKPSTLTATLLDRHPNEQGYEIAGKAVAEFLVNLLDPPTGVDSS